MPLLPRTTGFDTFSRQLVDSWGTSDSGHAWLGETSIHDTFYTAGTLGYGRVSVSSTDKANKIVYLDVLSSADQEILVKMKWSTDNVTDNGPILRNVAGANSNYFYTTLVDSSNQIKIGVYKNGVRTVLDTASKSLSKDTWYWVRTQITGTTFHSRVWAEGVVEPESWDVTATISSTTGPTTGRPGFRTQSEGTAHFVYLDTFYCWNDTLSDLGLPVTDTFTRNVHAGAGLSDSGHTWRGHVSDDPYLYGIPTLGNVQSSLGYFQLPLNNTTTDPRGMIGPDVTDVEVYTKVYCPVTTMFLRVGARAADGTSSGSFDFGAGEVYVRMQYGSTLLELYRDTTQVATQTLAVAPAAGEIWHIRFQAQGTTIRARAWKDGTAEPGSYTLQATSVASIAASGRAFYRMSYNNAVTQTMRMYDFNVTQLTNTNALTVGSLSTSNVTDTSFDVSASYTADADADSSITIQYKKSTDGTWLTASSPSVNRTTKIFSKSITGLEAGTVYNVRATYADPDGVNGNNPLTTDVTTTLKGTDVQQLLLATTDTLGEIYVEAHYTNDSDSDNSAVVDYRTAGTSSLFVDTFTDDDGVYLDDHLAGTGDPDEVVADMQWWYPANVRKALIRNGQVYPETNFRTIYNYAGAGPIAATYFVDADINILTLEGGAGVITRSNLTNYYYAYYDAADGGYWHFGKCMGGVDTDFYVSPDPQNYPVGTRKRVRIVTNGNQHTFYVGDAESSLTFVATQTDSSIGIAGLGGIILHDGTNIEGEGNVIDNFKMTVVTSAGVFSSTLALTTQTNGPSDKYRSRTLTGLNNDTFYEVRVTFTDADGVRNLNPVSNIIKTPGAGVAFDVVPMDITPYDSTAVIAVNYIFDTDNDSSITLQYRSIRDLLWTTVNQDQISVNRGTKTFRTILGHLTPNLSYQVKVTLNDPEGVFSGLTEYTAVFNTKGAVIDTDKRGKHYLHKIYGLDGEYLGTWNDAPEPRFSWDENGGLSDLNVELPRRISTINNDPTIDFGHRVDVWAIDTSDRGMGANLMQDDDMDLGSWTLTTSWSVDPTGGPDGSSALKFSSGATTIRTVLSETIDLPYVAPLIIRWVGRAQGGKLRLDIAAYDSSDLLIAASEGNSETVGTKWQTLTLEWLPPHGTAYVRVRVQNVGSGTMWFDKVSVLQREILIYRGFIEGYVPEVNDSGEKVTVEVLSIASQLTDYLVQFLQFVDIQPSRDTDEYPNMNRPPDDPSNMVKRVIDLINEDNPRSQLYYTGDSIKLTGEIVEYTFREQRADDCLNDIRNISPAGWHWYVDPDGLVHFRGEQHAETHQLRLAVEITDYENRRTVEGLKNVVIVRGRKDSDDSEPDGQGSIEYIALDQESITRYGRREQIVRDANIKDTDTAQLVGNGRLTEWNRIEEEVTATVPDEKDIRYVGGILGGYNIESFRPGDMIQILDPIGNDGRSYWDQMLWDDGTWDDNVNRTLPAHNPIKSIKYNGSSVTIDLSNRQPSSTVQYAKFMRWLREQETKSTNS